MKARVSVIETFENPVLSLTLGSLIPFTYTLVQEFVKHQENYSQISDVFRHKGLIHYSVYSSNFERGLPCPVGEYYVPVLISVSGRK